MTKKTIFKDKNSGPIKKKLVPNFSTYLPEVWVSCEKLGDATLVYL